MMATTTRRAGDAVPSAFDTIFARMLTPLGDAIAPTSAITVREAPSNLWETDAAYHAALLVPGLVADSIHVTIEGEQVTVAAERESLAVEGARAIWADFGPASYRRTFRFVTKLDATKAEASYVDGVLRLLLPKSPEAQPHRITVQVPSASSS